MVALKTSLVDRYLKSPDPAHRVMLLYGPDSGLVMERADALAVATGIDLKDPFSMIRLNADDVAEDRSRLADEAFTVGMFGGERLIRVSGSTRRNLVEAIRPVLDNPPRDAWIIIEAGNLDKRSALRTAIEKSPGAITLPCYQDSARALDLLIGEEITDKGLKIDREAADFLKSLLGSDRMASRNELRKLALYCGSTGSVSLEDIRSIVSDASAFDANDIIDAVADGDIVGFEENFERLLDGGLAPDMLLIFTLRHFQMLHELRSSYEAGRRAAQFLVDSVRPPLHFSRKKRIEAALRRLSVAGIDRALKRLERASYQARANPAIGRSVAGTCLLAITLEAARAKSDKTTE